MLDPELAGSHTQPLARSASAAGSAPAASSAPAIRLAAARYTSSPVLGGMSEWLKETGCKPVGSAYVGSNPTPSTRILV